MYRRSASRGRLTSPLLLMALACLLLPSLGFAAPVSRPLLLMLQKEITVVGTVQCGVPSGRACRLHGSIQFRTDGISGESDVYSIDIRWIADALEGVAQDDELTLQLEILPDGSLRALSLLASGRRTGTHNPGLSTGSRTVTEARHDRGQQQDQDPGGGRAIPAVALGVLGGVVRNGSNGTPLAGAVVRAAGITVLTDASGAFTFAELQSGPVTVEASASGFINQTLQTTLDPEAANSLVFALPQVSPDIALTLTWGAQPQDLDAHLSGPASGGGRFHLRFNNPNPETYASLTLDSQTGFGPEQVIIRRDPGTNLFAAGEYRLWIHNFTGVPEFDASGAQLRVSRDGQILATFDVGAAAGNPNLDLWHIVNLQLTANGDLTIVPVQQFVPGDGVTVLAPPYGSKPPVKPR